MVRAKFGLEYLHRPTVERLGLVILALVLEQTGEVVVADRNGWMILAENLFIDLHGPTIERLGLVVVVVVLERNCRVFVFRCDVWVICAVRLFFDSHGP